MKMKALFLFLILSHPPGWARSTNALRLVASVPFRIDQVIKYEGSSLIINPEEDPSIKVQVIPLKVRGPASNAKARRLRSRERVQVPSRIVIEAP